MTEQAVEQERQLPAVRVLTPTESHLADDAGMKLRQLEDGSRVWAVQAELRQRYNVLAPISTVAQVDSNWSPLPKIVIIEPGGYNTFKVGWDSETKTDIHAMQRVALDALAEASGIMIHRQWTERFQGGFKVNVVTRRRRADGLWDQRVRGCEVIYDDLAEEIEIGKLSNWEKYNKALWERKEAGEKLTGNAARDAKPPPTALDIRKEVLRERKFAPRKAETTAFGRCVRAHLSLPGAMPIKEYSKPFLCFTWVMTPDYSRAGTRELVSQLHSEASGSLYGDGEDRTMAIEDATVADEGLLPHELPDSTITHVQDGVTTVADSVSGEVLDDGPVTEDEPEFDFEADEREASDAPVIEEPEHGFTIAKRHPKYGGQHVRDVVQDGEEGWDLIVRMAKDTKADAQRDLILSWLSWASQNELTLDDL